MPDIRLVAVLGYSGRRGQGLHELCAERLRHAEQVATDGDSVLLSGWGRRESVAEAELMHAAWGGRAVPLIADSTARNTRENAVSVAETARRLAATRVTVVTSKWHAFRARALVRAALPEATVETSSPAARGPLTLLAREVICVAVLPYHLSRIRREMRRAQLPGSRSSARFRSSQ
jgi:uncharacterized SAM-binding protein YcdF (DUF218 family)